MKKSIAFTLAEVLIVMGIIGVIAEMTIPTLMNNTRKIQFLSGLKKAYTNVNQGLITMSQDLGCSGDITCIFDSSDTNTMGAKFVNYFKTAKICPSGTDGCFSDVIASNYDGTSKVSGYSSGSLDAYKFITADGMAFMMGSFLSSCGADSDLPTACMESFYVDVNGLKAPNAFGQDVFSFLIIKDKGFIPFGAPGIPASVNEYFYWKNRGTCIPADKSGISCGGRIMDESWQMLY